jgi:hypothetical protein
MASRISCIASARVSATATHPGKSGTYAPTDVGPCSRMTTYSMLYGLWLLDPSLLPNTRKCSYRDIDACFPCDSDGTWLRRVSKLPMTTASANKLPTIVLECGDDFANFHPLLIMPEPLSDVQREKRPIHNSADHLIGVVTNGLLALWRLPTPRPQYQTSLSCSAEPQRPAEAPAMFCRAKRIHLKMASDASC